MNAQLEKVLDAWKLILEAQDMGSKKVAGKLEKAASILSEVEDDIREEIDE